MRDRTTAGRSHDPRDLRESGRVYFVGRRQFESAEVYAVTGTDVDRLRGSRTRRLFTFLHRTPPAILFRPRALPET